MSTLHHVLLAVSQQTWICVPCNILYNLWIILCVSRLLTLLPFVLLRGWLSMLLVSFFENLMTTKKKSRGDRWTEQKIAKLSENQNWGLAITRNSYLKYCKSNFFGDNLFSHKSSSFNYFQFVLKSNFLVSKLDTCLYFPSSRRNPFLQAFHLSAPSIS